MNKTHSLSATPRELVGRKVKKLRKQGQVPANVYGKHVDSVSVVVALDAFEKVYEEAGETGLVELTVDGQKRPVLIHNVQQHPVTRQFLHIEFFQVNLKEKVKTHVPLEFVGEAPAVAEKIGALLTMADEVEVEALPAELPEKIEVDVSKLSEMGAEIKVQDLKVPTGVTVLTDPELTIAKIDELVQKVEEEPVVATPAEGEEGAEATEGTEGEKKEEASEESSDEKKEE